MASVFRCLTFVVTTPLGYYKCKRLPYGLSCAPEVFQKKCNEIFRDIPNVNIYIDDIVIATENEIEHNLALN